MPRPLLLILAVCVPAWTSAAAQSLDLRGHGLAPGPLTAAIGDTVRVDVWAQLDHLAGSGIDLHLSLPTDAFELVDQGAAQAGLQPFAPGDLVAGAAVVHNGLSDLPGAVAGDRLHLRYAAVMPPGHTSGLRGQGRVATIGLVVMGGADQARMRFEDTPIQETRLVLPDGLTERRFASLQGIDVSARPASTAGLETSWAQAKQLLRR